MKLGLIKGFLDGLRPEPRIPVSEWADTYRVLPSTASNEAGKYRTSRTPYLKQIMDDLSISSPVREVVVMKAAQIGASEMGNNWVGYCVHISPASMLMIQPTIAMAEIFSKMRIQPMIDNSDVLNERIKPARSRDSGNTILKKEFPGGILIIGGANSPNSLRSMPIKYLMLDEIDSYPLDLGEEGNPIDLAEARQRTYAGSKKTFKLSTPTIEGESMIAVEFEQTDQRFYHVPCPHCGGMQHLKFGQLRYDYNSKNRTASNVYYECEHCSGKIEERYKTGMLANGEWIATVPENANPKKAGYHINSLYSPLAWFSWSDAVVMFEKSKNDLPKSKTFTNTVLGETWKEKGEVPKWESLYNRRETYAIGKVPAEVAFLTAGVDIQKDRIELEVVGWCEGKITYSVDYRVLPGNTSGDSAAVWKHLTAVVDEVFEREDGAQLRIMMMAVDANYNTSEVYAFCAKHDATRVIPIQGRDKQMQMIAYPKPVNVNRKGKAYGKVKVWGVGTSIIKSELYGWLRLEQNEDGGFPNGYCHFPQYDPQYFKGITAESVKQIRDKKTGKLTYQWVKGFERNEPLDVRVYNRAAASALGMDLFTPARWAELKGSHVPKSKRTETKPKKKKSSFWDR